MKDKIEIKSFKIIYLLIEAARAINEGIVDELKQNLDNGDDLVSADF